MKRIFLLALLFVPIFIMGQSNYRLLIEGTPEKPLLNPVFSPDGNKIAFSGSTYLGLYIYDIQTKTSVQLTDEIASGFGFKWSSDSKSILTRVAKYDNQKRYNAVKVFNLETLTANQLTDYKTMMPYLPQWIDGDSKIYLPVKGNDEVISSGIEKNNFPEKIIAFEKNNKIIVKDISLNSEKVFEPINDAQYLNIVLSPDETKIVFEVLGGNMYVMNIDTGNLIDIGDGHRPKWSPDSKKVVYMILEDNGHEITSSDIYTINSDGTEKTNLSNTEMIVEMSPSFSPDGKSIIFENYHEGSIYLMSIE